MAATQVVHDRVYEEKRTAQTVLGGSLAEGIVSLAVIVLALVGLSGFLPERILPIATIAMGAAFLIEGGAVSMRYSKLLADTSKDRLDEAEFGVGVTSEYLGGVVGVVLGILSLIGLSPMLYAVAVIVYGATLMMSSGMTMRLDAMKIEGLDESARFKKIAHEAVRAATGVDFLLGLSALILGIIALTAFAGTMSATLSLVAMLIIGFSGLFTGAAITTRMMSLFRS